MWRRDRRGVRSRRLRKCRPNGGRLRAGCCCRVDQPIRCKDRWWYGLDQLLQLSHTSFDPRGFPKALSDHSLEAQRMRCTSIFGPSCRSPQRCMQSRMKCMPDKGYRHRSESFYAWKGRPVRISQISITVVESVMPAAIASSVQDGVLIVSPMDEWRKRRLACPT